MPESSDRVYASRLSRLASVSTDLSVLSDDAVHELVAKEPPRASGVGGASTVVTLGGVPVFVKRLSLSALERQPHNERSTANVFGLPAFCHYGIGGPGFGAWRELAVHRTTNEWVVNHRHQCFPLMYHWRVLAQSPVAIPEELADIESAVAFWGPRVRHRIEALYESTASVALFLEYFPQNAREWLAERVRGGYDVVNRACLVLDRELRAGISSMNGKGLTHFDGHLDNVLTDGQRFYFTDFGLATARDFDLSRGEQAFVAGHRSYDRGNAAAHVVHWLATFLCKEQGMDRDALLAECAMGQPPTWLPEGAAAILGRDGPLAAAMVEFTRSLKTDGIGTPYPSEKIQRLVP